MSFVYLFISLFHSGITYGENVCVHIKQNGKSHDQQAALRPFPRGMVQNKSSALWSVCALFIWRWDGGAGKFRGTGRIDAGGGAKSWLNSANVSLWRPQRGRINQ